MANYILTMNVEWYVRANLMVRQSSLLSMLSFILLDVTIKKLCSSNNILSILFWTWSDKILIKPNGPFRRSANTKAHTTMTHSRSCELSGFYLLNHDVDISFKLYNKHPKLETQRTTIFSESVIDIMTSSSILLSL